jgi:hypothetical protein
VLIVAAIALGHVVWLEARAVWQLAWEQNVVGSPDRASLQLVLRTAAAAFSSSADRPLVLFLGGSVVREFTGDDADVSRELSETCNQALQFVNLGSSSQSLGESYTLALLAPPARRRLVVFGLTPYRLDTDPVTELSDFERLPLGLPMTLSFAQLLHDFTGRVPNLLGSFGSLARLERLGVNWSWWDLMRLRSGAPTPLEPDPFFSRRNLYGPPVLDRAAKQKMVQEFTSWRSPSIASAAPKAIEMWSSLAEQLRNAGSTVAFALLPEDGSVVVPGASAQAAITRAAQVFRRHTVVIDLRELPGLSSDDFYDMHHLVATGRRKVLPAFVASLAQTLGCRRASPAS